MPKDINSYMLERTDRYGDLGKELTGIVVVIGTIEDAERVAERLSGYYGGCGFLFTVKVEE